MSDYSLGDSDFDKEVGRIIDRLQDFLEEQEAQIGAAILAMLILSITAVKCDNLATLEVYQNTVKDTWEKLGARKREGGSVH